MGDADRFSAGWVGALATLFVPVAELTACAMFFVAVDFVTGVAADRAAARRRGEAWRFSSRKAWRTVRKAGLVMLGICMAWLIDRCVAEAMELRLANLFTGFVCGVEFWSFLENASVISGDDLFRKVRELLSKHRSR